MQANQPVGSWSSEEFVAEWVGQDVLSDMLTLPRQISAALIADARVPVSHTIDLGAGPGAYLQTLLESFRGARGTWIDTSTTMETVARERLADVGDRVTFRLGDIEALRALELEPAEVIVTSRVVHHLSPESIQDFYRGVHDLLEPGGFFFNLDHFAAPGDWEPRYRRIRKQFTGKPKVDIPPHRHDFPFSPIDAHLGWLGKAGFETVDVPWRTFYTALLAGRKRA